MSISSEEHCSECMRLKEELMALRQLAQATTWEAHSLKNKIENIELVLRVPELPLEHRRRTPESTW